MKNRAAAIGQRRWRANCSEASLCPHDVKKLSEGIEIPGESLSISDVAVQVKLVYSHGEINEYASEFHLLSEDAPIRKWIAFSDGGIIDKDMLKDRGGDFGEWWFCDDLSVLTALSFQPVWIEKSGIAAALWRGSGG